MLLRNAILAAHGWANVLSDCPGGTQHFVHSFVGLRLSRQTVKLAGRRGWQSFLFGQGTWHVRHTNTFEAGESVTLLVRTPERRATLREIATKAGTSQKTAVRDLALLRRLGWPQTLEAERRRSVAESHVHLGRSCRPLPGPPVLRSARRDVLLPRRLICLPKDPRHARRRSPPAFGKARRSLPSPHARASGLLRQGRVDRPTGSGNRGSSSVLLGSANCGANSMIPGKNSMATVTRGGLEASPLAECEQFLVSLNRLPMVRQPFGQRRRRSLNRPKGLDRVRG